MTEAPPDNPVTGLLRRRGVQQFLRFCLVGASSAVVDFGIYYVLTEVVYLAQYCGGDKTLASELAQCVSFSFAVLNGFYWNNRWTFRGQGRGPVHTLLAKFVFTNIIGLALNLGLLWVFRHTLPDGIIALMPGHLKDPRGFVSKLIATAIVVLWNFTASKYFTFKS